MRRAVSPAVGNRRAVFVCGVYGMKRAHNAYTFPMLKRKSVRAYTLSIAIALAVGALAALLTHNQMEAFMRLNQPPLSPPGWVFPIVWTILYTLMGVSAARIFLGDAANRRDALLVYALQLMLNFGWTILFFGFHLFLAALIWLVVLDALIVVMIAQFYAADGRAAFLQLPYLLWCLFATYLNLGVALLNG